jgi:hypothetical protein
MFEGVPQLGSIGSPFESLPFVPGPKTPQSIDDVLKPLPFVDAPAQGLPGAPRPRTVPQLSLDNSTGLTVTYRSEHKAADYHAAFDYELTIPVAGSGPTKQFGPTCAVTTIYDSARDAGLVIPYDQVMTGPGVYQTLRDLGAEVTWLPNVGAIELETHMADKSVHILAVLDVPAGGGHMARIQGANQRGKWVVGDTGRSENLGVDPFNFQQQMHGAFTVKWPQPTTPPPSITQGRGVSRVPPGNVRNP